MVTIEQIETALRKCLDAHPDYTRRRLLPPDAERLCEALAEMNFRKLSRVKREVFQGEHLEALLKWSN